MGSPDPRAYSRNKRGIAGSLIWVNFDRHALLALFNQARGLFVADVDEIRPQFSNPNNVNAQAVFNSTIVRDAGPSIASTIDQLDIQEQLSSVGGWTELATPWFSDQILPFDITLGAANEYGAMAAAKIFGVEILNEGTGVSIDDSVTETQATFVARTIEPLRPRPALFFPLLPPSRSTPAITPIWSVTHAYSAIYLPAIAALPLRPCATARIRLPASLPPSQSTPVHAG